MTQRFRQLLFWREKDSFNKIVKATWEFFIPGVNSGAYDPTLHIQARFKEKNAGFFRFKEKFYYSEINLTKQEFDELFEEMKKIKAYRDGFTKAFVNEVAEK